MKEISLFRDSPQVCSCVEAPVLKNEVLPVRSPVAVARVRRVASGLRQAVHAAAVCRHLPDLETGYGAGSKTQRVAVRCPAQPVGKVRRAGKLVRGTRLRIDDLEFGSARNQKLTAGHPRSVRRRYIAQ